MIIRNRQLQNGLQVLDFSLNSDLDVSIGMSMSIHEVTHKEESEDSEELRMNISSIRFDPLHEGYHSMIMESNRGDLECKYYPSKHATSAVICAGDFQGKFPSPSKGLYSKLCKLLPQNHIAAMQLTYRDPYDMDECILDVLACMGYMEKQYVQNFFLIGHGIGGDIVLQATLSSAHVTGVASIATQNADVAEYVSMMEGDCALYLVHGKKDMLSPPTVAEYVYSHAHDPKQMVLFDNAGHELDEVSDSLTGMLMHWCLLRL